MRRFLLLLALAASLAGCDAFTQPPKLPALPEGTTELTGDGAWEAPYDLASAEWFDRFEAERPFVENKDFWLKAQTTPAAVFQRYDETLARWTVQEDMDRRNRWIGRTYRKGGRLVAVAIFLKDKHGAEFDILRVVSGPKHWYDPGQ